MDIWYMVGWSGDWICQGWCTDDVRTGAGVVCSGATLAGCQHGLTCLRWLDHARVARVVSS